MNTTVKKYLKVVYRWMQPLVDPVNLLFSFPRYISFIKDLYTYSHMPNAEPISFFDVFPRIHEKTLVTTFDKHYFYQDTWAFKKIISHKPNAHVDIGSSVNFVGFLSSLVKVKFVDIRPIETILENLEPVTGSILALPFANNSLESVSCLSVAEHIGLGRYGDPLDPLGTKKACREMARVLASNGNLYFAMPVGKPRTLFNAHRILSPGQILDYFHDLELVEFSAVDDKGNFIANADKNILAGAKFSCGLFWFTKP